MSSPKRTREEREQERSRRLTAEWRAIADALREERVRRRWSGETAARKIGCARSYLSQVENCHAKPNAHFIAACKRVYETSGRLDELLHKALAPDPKHRPIRNATPFWSLQDVLRSSQRRFWLTQEHIDTGMLHIPEVPLARIQTLLSTARRCLLFGGKGAGKTITALAFALRWENEWNERGWAGPHAFYLDVKPGQPVATAEAYLEILYRFDQEDVLFLVDDCHLAPEFIDEICLALGHTPLAAANLLFITRPRGEAVWEGEGEEYWDYFESIEATLNVSARGLYHGMLEACNHVYQQNNPDFCVSLKRELADPEKARMLEASCSHDLAVTRTFLDTWKERGGFLSDVVEGSDGESWGMHFVKSETVGALEAIAALGQYDISVDQEFLRSLRDQGVDKLRRDRLLLPEQSDVHGFRLDFHSSAVAGIYRACLRRRGRGVSQIQVTFTHLRTYLLSKPNNSLQVYLQLARHSEWVLRDRLLTDRDARRATLAVLRQRSVVEAVHFSCLLKRVDEQAASVFIESFTNELIALNPSAVIDLTPSEFTQLTPSLLNASEAAAKALLGDLSPQTVAAFLSECSGKTLRRWFAPSARSPLPRLGYDSEWKQKLADALDAEALGARLRLRRAQNLFWTLRSLKPVSRNAVRKLAEAIGAHDIGVKLRGQSVTVVKSTIQLLTDVGLSPDFQDAVLASVGSAELQRILNRGPLRYSGYVISRNRTVRLKYYQPLSKTDAFGRRLATADLADVSKFIDLLSRVHGAGPATAQQALQVLVTYRDLVGEVAAGNLEEVAHLLATAREIDAACAKILVEGLGGGKILLEVLDDSAELETIQHITWILLESAPDLQETLKQKLRTLDLAKKIPSAHLLTLGRLIWNAFTIDEELADRLCAAADRHLTVRQILEADGAHLALCLWNLSSLRLSHFPMILRRDELVRRIRRDWSREPGPMTEVIGTAMICDPEGPLLALGASGLESSPRIMRRLQEWIVARKNNPYCLARLALGAQGLSVINGLDHHLGLQREDRTRVLSAIDDAITKAERHSLELLQRAKDILSNPPDGGRKST